MKIRLAMAGALAFTILLASGPTLAQQQTKDQQKCTNAMNKDMGKVVAAQSKEVNDCIKNFAKGKLIGSVKDCLTADAKAKVQKTKDKTQADFDKSCTGTDKNGDPKFPPFGVTDVDTINNAAVRKDLKLVHDIFGSDLDSMLIPESADKDASKCQQALSKSAKKCQDTVLKEFASCKKNGMKSSPPTIDSAADLEACFGADPKAKIALACDDAVKPDGIRKTLDKQCTAKGVDLSDAFAGCNTDDAAEVHDCIDDAVRCRACRAINAADGLGISCACPIPKEPLGEFLGMLDDAAFCSGGSRDGEPCTDPITNSDCPGPPGTRCIARSNAYLNTAIAQPTVVIPLDGGIQVNCDAVNPPDQNTGKASCSCGLLALMNVPIPAIGNVCFSTADPNACPAGEIDCDGGNAIDLDGVQVHNVGTCGLSDDPNTIGSAPGLGNAECEALCDAHCASRGVGFAVRESGCEGYCQAGPREDWGCDVDADCPLASCEGGDPVAHRNKCNCACVETSGSPARAGGLMCQVSIVITVETFEPCMIVNGIDDRTIILPETCVPLTSEISNGNFEGMNMGVVNVDGGTFLGVPPDCMELVDPNTTALPPGIEINGQIGFFDSALGDLQVPVHLVTK